MATHALASWATSLTYNTLPPAVLNESSKSIYNWAGVAIGGFAQPAPNIALSTFTPFAGAPVSTLWGAPTITNEAYTLADPYVATLVNGIAAHVDDYDDIYAGYQLHASASIVAALLAVAEWKGPFSGREVTMAFVAGFETQGKLGVSTFPEHYDVGWHPTGTFGSIGSAVAVGKLLGYNTTILQHAIGIASTQVIGMQAFFGSMTKSFHPGRAAQSGLIAALLAENGYTAVPDALEQEYGWLHVVSTRENATEEFKTLGKEWELEKNTYKPFPCGSVIHASLDAATQLHNMTLAKGKKISDIKSVTLNVHPEVLVLTNKQDPKTGLEAKFSIKHAAAAGLIYGEGTPTQFTDEVVKNKKVIALRDKITINAPKGKYGTMQALVQLKYEDGSKLEKYIENALGTPENPLSIEQLTHKFVDQVGKRMGEERAAKASDVWWRFSDLPDVSQLRTMY